MLGKVNAYRVSPRRPARLHNTPAPSTASAKHYAQWMLRHQFLSVTTNHIHVSQKFRFVGEVLRVSQQASSRGVGMMLRCLGELAGAQRDLAGSHVCGWGASAYAEGAAEWAGASRFWVGHLARR